VLTFEQFVTTRGAAKALELSTALASGQTDAPRLLLLHGPPGVGKTHLLHSIAHDVNIRRPSIPVVQTSAVELIEEMTARLHRDRTSDLQPRWAPNAVVTIDDLHILTDRIATQREVGRVVRTALERGARLACAAGCPLSAIATLIGALREVVGARLVRLYRPGSTDIRRILREMARVEGLSLRAKALASMAAQCRGDVRRAASAITRQRFEAARRDPVAAAAPPAG
jgi:chromosomal replication initiator protein